MNKSVHPINASGSNNNLSQINQIVNNMDLISKSDTDAGTLPAANDVKSSPSIDNIPQSNGVVNDEIKEEASHREATASNPDTTPTTSENVPYTKSSSANNIPQSNGVVNVNDMQNGKIDASKVNLSIDKNFISNYDSWVSENRPDRRVITVGRTSDALKSIGVKEQKITWDTSKINKCIKKT